MKLEILLLVSVVLVSGCADISETNSSNNTAKEYEVPAASTYSEESVSNVELTLSNIQELEFYSKINDNQVYRKGWAEPVLLDDYAGTRENQKSFKLFHKEQGSPEFGQSELPVAIETSVYRFDNPGAAIKNMKDIIEGSDDIASSKLVSEDGTYYNRQIKVDSNMGPKVTAIYKRKGNVVLVAATSNFERFTVEETEQVMQKMVEKLESK